MNVGAMFLCNCCYTQFWKRFREDNNILYLCFNLIIIEQVLFIISMRNKSITVWQRFFELETNIIPAAKRFMFYSLLLWKRFLTYYILKCSGFLAAVSPRILLNEILPFPHSNSSYSYMHFPFDGVYLHLCKQNKAEECQ